MEGLCEDCTKCETRDQTGLYSAAYHGHDKCAEVLITGGADVNKRCDWNFNHYTRYRSSTPLMVASYHRHKGNIEKCVDLLIKAGADVDATDDRYFTPLMNFTYYGADNPLLH